MCFVAGILVASCMPQTEAMNSAVEKFLDETTIRDLLVGSCITGKLADGRPYQRSWTEDELEEVHTGHKNPLDWHYYHGEWSVSDDGMYIRTIAPWTRYYRLARNGDIIIWVEVDENGNELGNTYYGVIGDGCSRL